MDRASRPTRPPRGVAAPSLLLALIIAGALAAAIACAPAPAVASVKVGQAGPIVTRLQKRLVASGLLRAPVTGYFGPATFAALKAFQARHGLAADGVAGTQTLTALGVSAVATPASQPAEAGYAVVAHGDCLWTIARRVHTTVSALAEANGLSRNAVLRPGTRLREPPAAKNASRGVVVRSGHAAAIPWDEAKLIYTTTAVVTDVRTGLTFTVVRRGGTLHADSEPLTAADTATLKTIYGGSWSWNRRAIVVHAKGMDIAASMNGMPHGGEGVLQNGFPGHFCIHFLGSRIHASGKIDAQHQAMVQYAATHWNSATP